ncbi:MAG: lamin tail domain-containing protein [Myxococcales bacterium]
MAPVNKLRIVGSLACVLALSACPETIISGRDAAAEARDGSVSASDGSIAKTDGSVISTSDGSVVTPQPDGSVVTTPDGSVVTQPDGSVVTAPDGSVVAQPDAGIPTEILGHAVSPLWGSIVFNEVLMDGTTEGDPNGDGDANQVEDQFVELVNASAAAVALDGFTLVDLDFPDLPRHTFATFSLGAGHAVVVFGGGSAPAATASTTFFSANAQDPGVPFGLHLAASADAMLLLDGSGKVVAYFCYGGTAECPLEAASDESWTRSPDVTGGFTPHRTAAGSDGAAFSAGTKVDGSAF